MCRMFGFRSILQSGVHKSLLDADNAIIQQSKRHPDGWGVAYYNMNSPHLIKIDNQARECKIFEKVSGLVSSNTVVAHIRKSTVGLVGPLNTHPFQFGPWVFAHNGNIENFEVHRRTLLEKINKNLRKYILGDTDSEHLFYFLLTLIEKRGFLEKQNHDFVFQEIVQEFVVELKSIVGEITDSSGDYDKNYLTFILTNGHLMFALQGGQPLFFSTHKSKCSERNSCAFYGGVCEKKAQSGEKVHHLLLSSEVIKNENIWTALSFGECIGVDSKFNLTQDKITI